MYCFECNSQKNELKNSRNFYSQTSSRRHQNFKRSFEMKTLQLIKNRFFLKKHTPLPSTMELLKNLYPQVDWKRVEFFEGLPWFTGIIAPFVTAQALPHFYSFSKYRIYLIRFDESRAQCLADIVHEGFHVLQAMQFSKGYGLGFLRGLMVYYNALFLRH